ncbi:hypothetical protein PISL3812_06478 [Talaromyces islandicus]|uniref:Uncharacterized protein n=1 Tax=Talaromyces islandicus TaxID=28573 RepID=A0A0U1M251_TALIS|nr:hypothetical protein PISL3812_06478 [Talaromyces islandicus]
MSITFLNLPDKNDDEFVKSLYPSRSPTSNLTYTGANLQSDGDQQPREWPTKRHAPYASFGDQGTTASVGVYGSLMRICRHMKRELNDFSSRMVGLEFTDGMEAWYVHWRAEEFLDRAQDPASGFGLRLQDVTAHMSPTLKFLADRWPVITYKDDRHEVMITLWCQKGVVVQQMRITRREALSKELQLALNPNFAMQDLDYSSWRDDLPVKYQRAPHGYGIIALEDQSDFQIEQERVCVVIGLFKDGIAQELPLNDFNTKLENRSPITIPVKHEFEENAKSVEFTVTFKLQLTTLEEDWKYFTFSGAELNCDTQSSIMAVPFPGDLQLSWHLCRNLEHIMSTCSIPLETSAAEVPIESTPGNYSNGGPMIVLNTPNNENHTIFEITSPTGKTVPVALTCGDFGDHRVTVSGSYFAFMFMLEMYDRLSSTPLVRQRIHEICKGHLQWVKQLSVEEALSSNLRIDGRLIAMSRSTDLPPNNPISLPSHIIKATQYLKVFNQMADYEFVCGWLDEIITNWFKHLMQTKNRLTPTWQHSTDSEIPTYRLSDQVWIWKALRDIEELIENIEGDRERMAQGTLQTFLRIKAHLPSKSTRKPKMSHILDFTAEEMRKQNLRRFTLENDILKKRMLSVTRSARETRFLLHSRDTILYYGMEWGFFPGEEAIWQQLINAQIQHDEDSNDEAQWDNPLRYGLALEMAGYEHQLDRNFLPADMATHAKQVIIDSSSENGLFPGQLDGFSKEPALFDRELFRDFYFHVGFEVPYILLRAAKRSDASRPVSEKPAENPPESPVGGQSQQDEVRLRGDTRVSRSKTRARDQSPNLSALPEGATQGYISFQADGRALVVQRTLKRKNHYGRLTDLSNIVEIPEEWLYRYPDFLDFEPPKEVEEAAKILSKAPPILKDINLSIVRTEDFTQKNVYVTIEDVRKGRKYRKWNPKEKYKGVEYSLYTLLWNQLVKKRTAEWSKKRIVCLESLPNTLAAMLYVTSPEAERMHMAQFFDRHAKVDANYLYDDTTVILNTWVTEVHFRFFQARTSKAPERDQQRMRQLKFQPCRIFGRDAYLVDAIISFRIVGDYFDRYWTCHLIQEVEEGKQATRRVTEGKKETHWQQRKILELFLFNTVVEEVCSSLDKILTYIEKPQVSTSDQAEWYFSKDGLEDRKPEDLRESFQVLVILKNNITSLQSLIEQWNCRESLQGRERPRWTPNDEQKYRKAIKQKQAHLEDLIREIKAKNARIEFMITRVTNAEDAIRSKKSLKEAENITVFTYVTVFFLPVGLAVGVFSMNGAPDHKVIIQMVITAAVAFLITASILWCMLSQLVAARVASIWDYIYDRVPIDHQHSHAKPVSKPPNPQPSKSLQLFKRRRKSRSRMEDLEDQKLYEE